VSHTPARKFWFDFALAACGLLFALAACVGGGARQGVGGAGTVVPDVRAAAQVEVKTDSYAGKVAYVIVALCDNVNQGIVPVPAALGNGEDPARNLYWGARFGVKTHFNASREWRAVTSVENPAPKILERVVFKHKTLDAYLVADAYRGAEIKQATVDFFNVASGNLNPTFEDGGRTYGLGRGAAAHLVAYVGHDGLMDFQLPTLPKQRDDVSRDAVILACISKKYFAPGLKETGARPLVWTTNLMAPEAYVLKAALDGWLAGEDGESVRQRTAKAYDKYQNCGLRAAQGLFATGW
jgi:hypothetical protein